MIRFLSYIYPITKKIKSKYNGLLEITWYNGKKHLNTKNANYSYGSLQKILSFGLEQINLKNCHCILLLGLGGGSVIETLVKELDFKGRLTAVEIDPVIIDIAKNEFHVDENNLLQIICDDAKNFILNNTAHFDLIIIDLFVDNQVPNQFLSNNFWQHVIRSNSKNGQILFNASIGYLGEPSLQNILKLLKSNTYQSKVFTKVEGSNTLLIAKKSDL